MWAVISKKKEKEQKPKNNIKKLILNYKSATSSFVEHLTSSQTENKFRPHWVFWTIERTHNQLHYPPIGDLHPENQTLLNKEKEINFKKRKTAKFRTKKQLQTTISKQKTKNKDGKRPHRYSYNKQIDIQNCKQDTLAIQFPRQTLRLWYNSNFSSNNNKKKKPDSSTRTAACFVQGPEDFE